ERFKAIMNDVKAKTGAKGKDLFHPVRVALTGSHSGPEFDKLIPILEQGSQLDLPQHVMNVGERLAAFRAARGMSEVTGEQGFQNLARYSRFFSSGKNDARNEFLASSRSSASLKPKTCCAIRYSRNRLVWNMS